MIVNTANKCRCCLTLKTVKRIELTAPGIESGLAFESEQMIVTDVDAGAPCVGRKSHILRWFYEEVLQRFYLYVNWRYATSLSYEFAEKFLNDSPKSLDELLDALILYRKDFNAKYVAKVAASFPKVGAVKNGRKKLVKKKQKRIHDLKKRRF